MEKKTLKDIFKICGGMTAVARVLKVDRKTIWVWSKKGFPRTEWTGETNYTEMIERLCLAEGVKISADKLLEISL